MTRNQQPKAVHQMTVGQFDDMFPNEDACAAYLVARRWPEGVACPRCGTLDPTPTKGNPFHWQCYACAPETSYRFSHIAGTIFENTNKPLKDWFRVIHLMLTSKKGMSALQIMRYMGFGSYKTAWYMCHRIRTALADQDYAKLAGIVEVDETFVGGKRSNRHKDKRGPHVGPGTGPTADKAIVVGAVKRKGNVVARVIENTKSDTLNSFINETVSTRVSLLCTDQWIGYQRLNENFPHGMVDHSKGQYVIGAIHTNTIEGFWSLIKRGMVGTFHKVSKKYLPLYVAEFQFRYNNRLNADIFGAAIKEC
jgi:transposase-like protein